MLALAAAWALSSTLCAAPTFVLTLQGAGPTPLSAVGAAEAASPGLRLSPALEPAEFRLETQIVPPAAPAPTAPNSATLSQARVFPNPWRSDGRGPALVTFDRIPDGAEVSVYAVSGRLVRRLIAGAAGASWDLTDDSGERAASGFYLYLIRSGDARRLGRLALVR